MRGSSGSSSAQSNGRDFPTAPHDTVKVQVPRLAVGIIVGVAATVYGAVCLVLMADGVQTRDAWEFGIGVAMVTAALAWTAGWAMRTEE